MLCVQSQNRGATVNAASPQTQIIVCGHASDEALRFLSENGSFIEQYRNLFIIQLPANAVVGREENRRGPRRHGVIFLDEVGEQVDHLAVIVTLKINATSTRLDLVFDTYEKDEEENL